MLKILAWIYGQIVDIRNTLYDRGVLRSYELGARTISIGNITTGGTGKTPLVAHVAEILADTGEKVCILTRGYDRNNERERVLVSDGENVLVDAVTGGDEPVELARKLLGKAVVVADADRVSAATWATERFDITAFVLDDAFQHRRVKRDLDIVCIDATDPFGGNHQLPAGLLRERVENLARADAFVITRSDLIDSNEQTVNSLRTINPDSRIFFAHARLNQIKTLGSDIAEPHDLQLSEAFAFCGIANPSSFFSMLERNKLNPANRQTFPDHHRYTQEDVERLVQEARSQGCELLVTTAKDATKLETTRFELPCFVVEMTLAIDDPAGFRDLVLSS